MSRFPADAVALRPVRFIGSGDNTDLRFYEGVEFLTKDPSASCDMYYRRCEVFSGVAKGPDDASGICDVLDKNGDIIDDFWLTAAGLNWLYRTLKTRVDKGVE